MPVQQVRDEQKPDERSDVSKFHLYLIGCILGGTVGFTVAREEDNAAYDSFMTASYQQCSNMLSTETMKYESTEHYLDTHYVDAKGFWHAMKGKKS